MLMKGFVEERLGILGVILDFEKLMGIFNAFIVIGLYVKTEIKLYFTIKACESFSFRTD